MSLTTGWPYSDDFYFLPNRTRDMRQGDGRTQVACHVPQSDRDAHAISIEECAIAQFAASGGSGESQAADVIHFPNFLHVVFSVSLCFPFWYRLYGYLPLTVFKTFM